MSITIAKRNQQIFQDFKERVGYSLDFLLITNHEHYTNDRGDPNFNLVTGIPLTSFIFATAIVYPEGNYHLLIPELEQEKLSGLGYDIEHTVFERKNLWEKMNNLLPGTHSGINSYAVSKYFTDTATKKLDILLTDVDLELAKARLNKTDQEMDLLVKAGEVSDRVISSLPEMIHNRFKQKGFVSETGLQADIDYHIAEAGQNPAFPTIVAFRYNTADPHYHPGDTKPLRLKEGDLILVDFGSKNKCIGVDMTRVFSYGEPKKEHIQLYNEIFRLKKEAEDRTKIGANGKDIATFVEDEITKFFKNFAYPGKMGHSLGHATGFNEHDIVEVDGGYIGLINKNYNFTIPESLVAAIEPAGYITQETEEKAYPKFGVRLEDTGIVETGGFTSLTGFCPEELPVIEIV